MADLTSTACERGRHANSGGLAATRCAGIVRVPVSGRPGEYPACACDCHVAPVSGARMSATPFYGRPGLRLADLPYLTACVDVSPNPEVQVRDEIRANGYSTAAVLADLATRYNAIEEIAEALSAGDSEADTLSAIRAIVNRARA